MILSGHCRITHFKNPGIFFCFRVLFCLGAVQLQKLDKLVAVDPDFIVSLFLGFVEDELETEMQMWLVDVVGIFRTAVAGAAQIADYITGLDDASFL